MKMGLYSIRDRLINYFMVPFPAVDLAQTKAAIAQQVNNGDGNAISQAPHQFELWRLAEIDTETGHIWESREYLCDLSSLIRGSVRQGTEPGRPGTVGTSGETQGSSPSPPGGHHGQTGAPAAIPGPAAPTDHPEAPPAHPETGGVH